jgi:uncharacterized protein (TIGR00369 family)
LKINAFAVSLVKTIETGKLSEGQRVAKNKDLAFLKDFYTGNTTSALIEACPVAALLGARVISLSEDKIEIKFEAGHQMLQGAGVVQGGQISSMLDFAMALIALSRLDEHENVSTISLTTDFHRPAGEGILLAEAWITKMGRKVIFSAAKLTSAEGKSVATATASSMITKME